MPVTIRQLRDGTLHMVDYVADSLAHAAQFEPDDGVYTVATTVNSYDVLRLTAHLDRLADSANREGINLTLSHGDLRGVIREVIRIAGYGDVKFRLTVPKATPDAPIISVEPFPGYPRSLYTDGVRMTSSANSARHNAAAKDTRWMHAREALRGDTDAYEVLLLDADGAMLEGTSSNFYAVKNDTLYTALEGVLAGTSRGIIFEVAPQVLPLVRRALHVDDVSLLQEAFITSSSRGIVPVVQIDDTTLGDGKPGPYTRQLMTVYRAWVADHLETL